MQPACFRPLKSFSQRSSIGLSVDDATVASESSSSLSTDLSSHWTREEPSADLGGDEPLFISSATISGKG